MNGSAPRMHYEGPGSEFMNFGAAEAAALEPTDWERWVARVEQLLGHDLDGDDSADAIAAGTADGYSLDSAYDAWKSGASPDDHVDTIQARKEGLAVRP